MCYEQSFRMSAKLSQWRKRPRLCKGSGCLKEQRTHICSVFCLRGWQGLDELVDKQTQQMLMDRQLALGMTTVLISRHDLPHQAPPVLHIPGALAILVNRDGTTRHWVGRAPSTAAPGNASSGLSETSDNDHYEPYRTDDVTSDSNCDSDAKPNVSPLKKKRSVAGHAGKVLKDGFKGIGKAGRLFGRTVAYAPSLLPSVSSFSS